MAVYYTSRDEVPEEFTWNLKDLFESDEKWLEALEELNHPVPSSGFDQYHIGISNLRRRMSILFRGDSELAFFNGISGGANVLISIPVREEGEDES